MLRDMQTGEPVQVSSGMSSIDRIAGLAAVAEQFGYQYANVRRGDGYVMSLVIDTRPQARARAAQNWAQYPDAAGGGALPPFVPKAFQLLKTRITIDLSQARRPADGRRVQSGDRPERPAAVPATGLTRTPHASPFHRTAGSVADVKWAERGHRCRESALGGGAVELG